MNETTDETRQRVVNNKGRAPRSEPGACMHCVPHPYRFHMRKGRALVGTTLILVRVFENMRGGRFLMQIFLLVGMALFQVDTFSIAPTFATGASSVKVERHVAPEPLADTSASPSRNASTIVGTELTHSLDDGPAFLVCISAADLPLAGRLTACIIDDGSCPNTMSCPYLSTAVGGTGLCRIPAGNSTIDPCAFCRGAAGPRAGRNSMTADDGLRKGARQVFEVALEEPFFEGKLGDADVKYEYSCLLYTSPSPRDS